MQKLQSNRRKVGRRLLKEKKEGKVEWKGSRDGMKERTVVNRDERWKEGVGP